MSEAHFIPPLSPSISYLILPHQRNEAFEAIAYLKPQFNHSLKTLSYWEKEGGR